MSDDKFRSLRLAQAWFREQLAEFSGLSVRTVQRIENGDQPSRKTLSALAAVIGSFRAASTGAVPVTPILL